MFGQSLLSAFGIACTTDTDQLFTEELQAKTAATLQLNGNTDSLDIAGKFGGCAKFNGSSSTITSTNQVIPNGASSISFWYNPQGSTGTEYIIGQGIATASKGPTVYWSSQSFGALVAKGTSSLAGSATGSTTYSTTDWHNVVFTWDGTSNSNAFKVYVNGTLLVEGTSDTSSASIGAYTYLGIGGLQGGTYANGLVDQVRIFNTELTASQVSDLYNETTSTASTLNYPTTAVALYQLNGNATDTSGTYNGSSSNIIWAYNGTAVNPAYTTGKFGQAYDFSANGTGTVATGTSSYITFADDMSRANNFSWSFWIKSTGTPSNYPTLVSFYGTYVNYIYFSPNIATMYLAFSDGADTTFSTGLTSLSDWTHFAFTKSSTSGRKFYINGTSVFSDNTTANAGAAPRTGHAIGMHWASQGDWRYPLNGDTKIDQFRLFEESLDQDAITALYNETVTTATYNYIDYTQGNSIAYYKMSDAKDQLGNYNGTPVNMDWGEGKFGFAGSFNGSSSYITLPNSVEQPFILAQQFGVSMWFKIDALPTGGDEEFLISLYQEGYLDIRIKASGVIEAKVAEESSGTDRIVTSSSGVVSAGTWHHVVWTGAANNLVLYIDNSSVATGSTWNGTFYHSNAGCSIGSKNNGTSDFFDGKIDQIRLYDEVLTATEVDTLYKEVYCQPTAIVGTNFFNTVLYTGDGTSSRSITGVGFAPDFVWTKKRGTSTGNNILENTVVGVGTGSSLSSNSNTAAGNFDQYGYISSFNTNGVTYQAGSSGSYPNDNNNENSSTYVQWNWKGGDYTYAGQFGGGSDRIDISQTLLGSGSTKIFSTSFWFKTSNTVEQYINNTGAAGNNTGFGIFISPTNGYLRYQVSNGSGSFSPYLSLEDRSVQDGKWHHVVATYSSAGGTNDAYMYLYLDGQDVTSLCTAKNSWTQGGGATWSSFTIPRISLGNWADSSGQPGGLYPLIGSMDQTRFFNTALTSSQVTELYGETASNNNTLNFPAGAGCIAAYAFDETADDVGGSYNGTASGISYTKPGYLGGNTAGTIPSEVVANTNAGFSIVKWTGSTSSSSESVGHGLGKAPELVILKNIDATDDWYTYAEGITGNNQYLKLNTTGAVITAGSDSWGAGPTSSVMGLRPATFASTTAQNLIMYCFTSIPGYSRISSYVGTGGALDVYCGFKPAWVLFKSTSSGASNVYWTLFDNKRNPVNPRDCELYPNSADYEYCVNRGVNFTDTGIGLLSTSYPNESGVTFIFMAFAE